jgi:hypothetical protein
MLDGGTNTSGGPLLGDAVLAPNPYSVASTSSSLRGRLNSRAQQRELFIDIREFATGLFLIGFGALVVFLVAIGFAGYRAFVS